MGSDLQGGVRVEAWHKHPNLAVTLVEMSEQLERRNFLISGLFRVKRFVQMD
jgi:hypothetical protein